MAYVVIKDNKKFCEGSLYTIAEYLGMSATKLAWEMTNGNELEVEVITKHAYMKRKGEK